MIRVKNKILLLKIVMII